MKKLIMALALVLCVATFVSAQGQRGGTPQERAERSIARLEPLKLTADQKAKLTEVYLAQGKSLDSLRTANGGTFDREKMAPLQAATNKRILVLLNDEQKKAFEAMEAERRARMNN